jgi:arsenate reductase (thioredoxin)
VYKNAARSQMAEAFFRKYAPHDYESLSAGTRPSGQINPVAIQVMKEIGIDIVSSSSSNSSKQKPKEITEDMIRNSEKIINMGCMDKAACPTLFLHNNVIIDWNIEDPKGKPIEKVREIRDIIQQRVKELVSNLSTPYKQINF